MLHGDVDLLFCNEDEVKLLFGSHDTGHAVDRSNRRACWRLSPVALPDRWW